MWYNIKIEVSSYSGGHHNIIKRTTKDDKLYLDFDVFIFQKSYIHEVYYNTTNIEVNTTTFKDKLYNFDEPFSFSGISLNSLLMLLEACELVRDTYDYIHSCDNNQVFNNLEKSNKSYRSPLRRFKTLIENIRDKDNYRVDSTLKSIIFYLLDVNTEILDITLTRISTKRYYKDSTSFKKDIFKEINTELAHRYAVLEKPGKIKNLIVDSFLPQYFIKHKFNLIELKEEFSKISSSATMIHRGFARMLGIRELPFEDMLTVIGYTKENISTLLTNVRAKKLNIAFAGYGGVGTNTIYWLTQMCNICNIQGLFNKIIIADPDTLSLDNIFRMPNPFVNHTLIENTDLNYILTHKYSSSEYNQNSLYKTKNIPQESLKALSTKTAYITDRELDGYTFQTNHINNMYNWIAYGAPDINTRKLFTEARDPNNEYKPYRVKILADYLKVFISATHGDNDCNLVVNPKYSESESNLMVESYGIIQLNVFFFNQLRLAISFLETLEKYSYEELVNMEETEILNYSIVGNQKANKYNLAFQDIRTIQTVENIERQQ